MTPLAMVKINVRRAATIVEERRTGRYFSQLLRQLRFKVAACNTSLAASLVMFWVLKPVCACVAVSEKSNRCMQAA